MRRETVVVSAQNVAKDHCRRVSELLFNSYVGVLDISSYTSTSTHSGETRRRWESNEMRVFRFRPLADVDIISSGSRRGVRPYGTVPRGPIPDGSEKEERKRRPLIFTSEHKEENVVPTAGDGPLRSRGVFEEDCLPEIAVSLTRPPAS